MFSNKLKFTVSTHIRILKLLSCFSSVGQGKSPKLHDLSFPVSTDLKMGQPMNTVCTFGWLNVITIQVLNLYSRMADVCASMEIIRNIPMMGEELHASSGFFSGLHEQMIPVLPNYQALAFHLT